MFFSYFKQIVISSEVEKSPAIDGDFSIPLRFSRNDGTIF